MPPVKPPFSVGGQAVIEGVMMRAKNCLAIAVKKPDGSVLVKEDRICSLAEKFPWLRWPFFRGPVVLLESLVYGIKALNFSAQAAVSEEEEQFSPWTLTLTMLFAFGMALLFFGLLPHYLSGLIGRLWGEELSVNSFAFHLIDGVLKVGFFLLYVWAISFMGEIRRVFEYHGAEHKSIFTFEAGEALTVENARKFEICHPRCGTSFILVVLLTSIVVFTLLFPLLPSFAAWGRIGAGLIQVGIKVLLMFPIAALSYEIIRLGGRFPRHPLTRMCLWPGLWTQRLTAREPNDEQLEVGLAALNAVLAAEQRHSHPSVTPNPEPAAPLAAAR